MKLRVNGREVEVVPGATVLQACEAAGAEIPRFCYHERLLVAGNCRRCLVEIEKSPKPVASCARPAAAGRSVHTDTPLVRKAREGVREFLLANHPLDCPICDQGGECDLQDQSRAYGSDRSRFFATKRSVEDKDLGPVVKTVRTRCIQCTRCVRFATEVAGVGDLGATGRGNQVEIGTYIGRRLTSELSGNVIDLCPVGALTAKPLSATYRPWELESHDGVDPFDGRGSAVRWQTRAGKLRRALPRYDEEWDQEWATDKLRFAWDGLRQQRLGVPQVRVGDAHVRATSEELLADAAEGRVEGGTCRVVRGPNIDWEGGNALDQWRSTDSLFETRTGSVQSGFWSVRKPGRLDGADVIVFVGTDPRREAPLLNVKFRERFLSGECKFYSYGPVGDLTYPVQSRVKWDPAVIADAKRPLVFVGESGVVGAVKEAGAEVFYLPRASNSRDAWAAEPRFSLPWARSVTKVDFQILVGVTEGDRARVGLTPAECLARANYTLVLGTHGEDWRAEANAVQPILTWLEKAGTRRNRRGELLANPAVVSPRSPEARSVENFRAVLPRRKTSPVSVDLLPSVSWEELRRRPSRVDYHREGHALARYSPTRAKCSAARKDSNFK